MKKYLITILLASLSSVLFAQWTTPTPPTGITTTNDKIGIGTTSPVSKVEVVANSGSTPILKLFNTDGVDGRSVISFGSNKSPSQAWEFGQNVAGGNKIFGLRDISSAGNPIRFVVNSDGNFGIGTSSPSATLDVNGFLSAGTNSGNLDGRNLSFLQNSARLLIGWNRTGGEGETAFISNQGPGGSGGYAFYDYNNNGIQNQLFRIKSNGNVGVGIPNPASKLTINSSENNAAIEIVGNATYTYNQTSQTHYLPALTYYANQSQVRSAPSSQVVFADRPGTSGYPNNARTSDILFYTAHSYDQPSNAYGIYPDLTMVIKSTQDGGNVGIGTSKPDQKLTVNGTIHATEVLVDQTVAQTPDYVFDKDYDLTPLKDVKTYIDKNHHLPEIPSAAQAANEGINLGEMNAKLLKKIEELTLYLIEKDTESKTQKRINIGLQDQIGQLKLQVIALSTIIKQNR